MLGLNKSFVIFLFVSVLVAWYFKSWQEGASIMIAYIIIKLIWNIATK